MSKRQPDHASQQKASLSLILKPTPPGLSETSDKSVIIRFQYAGSGSCLETSIIILRIHYDTPWHNEHWFGQCRALVIPGWFLWVDLFVLKYLLQWITLSPTVLIWLPSAYPAWSSLGSFDTNCIFARVLSKGSSSEYRQIIHTVKHISTTGIHTLHVQNLKHLETPVQHFISIALIENCNPRPSFSYIVSPSAPEQLTLSNWWLQCDRHLRSIEQPWNEGIVEPQQQGWD